MRKHDHKGCGMNLANVEKKRADASTMIMITLSGLIDVRRMINDQDRFERTRSRWVSTLFALITYHSLH